MIHILYLTAGVAVKPRIDAGLHMVSVAQTKPCETGDTNRLKQIANIKFFVIATAISNLCAVAADDE